MVLMCLGLFLIPARAGEKVSGLGFQPAQGQKVPCLFQPFSVAQRQDPFFRGLEQVRKRGKLQFRRGRDVVSNFPDALTIWVDFRNGPTALSRCSALPAFDPAKLKFSVQWKNGSQISPAEGKFLVSEESSPETWCEDNCSARWSYELRIDSQNVPLTDELVIRIDAENGTSLAEYVGKIGKADSQTPPLPMQVTNLAPAP